jgi:O-antigen ligase
MSTGFWIALGLIVLVVLGILSIPFAISPGLAAYTVLRWLIALAFFFLLINVQFSVEKLVLVYIIGLVIQVFISVAQVVVRGPLGIPGEVALAADTPGAAVISVQGNRWLRAYGMTFHPNVFGGFLAVGLVLGMPLLRRKWTILVWWLLIIGLILTFSRSAWLGAAVIVPFVLGWIFWRFKEYRRNLVTALSGVVILGLVGLFLLGNQIWVRLSISTMAEITSLAGRSELIRIALKTIVEKPLFGIGAGNFPLLVLNVNTLVKPHYVHNVPLLLAAEIGLFAGLVWYFLWFFPIAKLGSFWRGNYIWSVVVVGAWFMFGIISLWDFYPWGLESGRLLTMMLLGLVILVLTKPVSLRDNDRIE